MASFKPCIGRNACRDDGQGCLTCGRSFEEINATKEVVDTVFNFVREMGYDNHDEFMAYLSRKISKKIAHAEQQ